MRRHDREVKNLEGIREILDVCKVCRLGMYDGGEVYIVPMNYGYELDGDRGRLPVSTVIIMEVSSEAGEPGSLRNLTRN